MATDKTQTSGGSDTEIDHAGRQVSVSVLASVWYPGLGSADDRGDVQLRQVAGAPCMQHQPGAKTCMPTEGRSGQ